MCLRCPHDVTIAITRVLAFQHLHHDRPVNQQSDQIGKEGPILVYAVKPLGLLPGHADAPGRHHAEPGLLQLGGNRAREVAAGRIGLDDRTGARVGHYGDTPEK